MECAPVKVDNHIEASSTPHFPACPIIHNASACIRDTTRSLTSSSYDLSPQLTLGNEFIHDENSLNAQDSSHLSSSCVLHEDNSSSQLAENFDEVCDKYCCHPKSSFEIKKITILKPCMIWCTSKNENFQFSKVSGHSRESRHFNVC